MKHPITTKPKKTKPKEPAFSIDQAGETGKKVFNDIVNGVTDLVPVKGRIYVEINLLIEDENLFKDDERRTSKLVIEVDLERDKIVS